MFNLFKSAPSFNIVDKVWMGKQAKWKACAAMASINTNCLFVAWFEDTVRELKEVLGSDDKIVLGDRMDVAKATGKMIVFAEHYPLAEVEQKLFAALSLKEIPIVSSLDEHLFMHFGGEKTIALMKKLGMKEDEAVGHAMITASIKNAQSKLAKHIVAERKTSSAREWFELNVPSTGSGR